MHRFEQNDDAQVAVIHGMGGHFSSGYDLDELRTVAKNSPHDLEKSLIVCSVTLLKKGIEIYDDFILLIILFIQLPYQRKTTKPILCGISGVCKSIGFEIALMGDLRILENSAILGFTNYELGIPHSANGPRLLADLIGHQAAFHLLTNSSKELSSHEAHAMGITCKDVVEDGTGTKSHSLLNLFYP